MMPTQSPWDLLRSGPDDLDPGPGSWATTQRCLREAYRDPARRGHPARAGRWRLTRRSVLAGAAVAAAAVAAAIVVPATLPGHSPGAAPSAAAVAVLTDAADVARSQPSGEPLGDGQYLYLKIDHGNTGGGVYPLDGPHTAGSAGPGSDGLTRFVKQLWIAADGSGRQLVRTLGPQPRTLDAHEPAGTFTNAVVYTGNLPLNPDALNRAIGQRFEGGHSDTGATFQFAGTFLQADATPRLRAALYRMIATLPGVVSLGPMTDTLGRHGIAVGIKVAGDRQMQLIFDPHTSAVLQMQETDSHGQLVLYDTYVSSGIVDSTTTSPATH